MGLVFGLQYYREEEKLIFEHLKDFGGFSTIQVIWTNDSLSFCLSFPICETRENSVLESGGQKGRPTEKAWGIKALTVLWVLPLHDTGMFPSVYLSVFCFLHRLPNLLFEVHLIIAF